jgi:type I restriction enzyme R subunit
MNEADTCRKYIVPKLQAAGWDDEPHSIAEQRTFTDGRIVPLGDGKARRRKPKRADYVLRYTRDFPIAVVEAKASYKCPGDGLQQAKDYAEILGLKFAYASNGEGILEFDYLTGKERELDTFPKPDELWTRLRGAEKLGDDATVGRLLTPVGEEPPLLPGDRDQPGRPGRAPGEEARPSHDGHGHGEDRGGLPGVLEALVLALEPRR